ncbi:ABC transporter permease [Streptomyces triticagri]|uniref:ABC transporter permease n=1 Tax=Streptomyces triticagri TaxID=2293568 RepID=A0A372M3G0_9ACTN|nr:ABC transporter permease [Streptomyces triticagri]
MDPRPTHPRFTDLLAAEWLKLWSLRSTPWTLGLVLAGVVAFNAAMAWDTYRYWTYDDPGEAERYISDGIPFHEAFNANAALCFMLAVAAVGAVTVVGEYGTGLIRTTFVAVPARRSLLGAKVLVVSAVTTVLGGCAALGSFLLTQAILSGRGVGVSLGHPGAWRVVLASALIAPVCALFGMAVGVILRHTATTLALTFGVLVVLPPAFSEERHWSAVVNHAQPFMAWNRLTDVPYEPAAHPWSTAGAWSVYAVWALVAAAVTVLVPHRRDR